jgi:hypothetical protein
MQAKLPKFCGRFVGHQIAEKDLYFSHMLLRKEGRVIENMK